MHVMHCREGKPLAHECDCVCLCVCIKRAITCSMWWVILRLVCQGAAGWLEAVRQETHQLCTAELKTPVRFTLESLTFLLTDVWFAVSCKIAAFTCYMLFCKGSSPTHCNQWLKLPVSHIISSFNAFEDGYRWFDGFGTKQSQDGKILCVCVPILQPFSFRSRS